MLILHAFRRARPCLLHPNPLHLQQTSRSFTQSGPLIQSSTHIQNDNGSGKKSVPEKIIPDWLAPQPALRLATLLKDILPTTRGLNDDFEFESKTLTSTQLALPDHLVYFPIQAPPSQLAPDGADLDHVPHGFVVADANEPPGQDHHHTRLWQGGSVTYHDGWRESFRPNAQGRNHCREVVLARQPGDDRPAHHVNIRRDYGLAQSKGLFDAQVVEKRTLVFVKSKVAEHIWAVAAKAALEDGEVVDMPSSSDADHAHEFITTPAQLFQFSALTFNAHHIHLDPKAGLVHGPLQQALMLRVVEQHVETEFKPKLFVSYFEYTCNKPLMVGQKARVCLKRTTTEEEEETWKWRVWIERRDGTVIAAGTVEAKRAENPPK